jgi:polyisoprenoid-binding protein YceI
MSLLLLCLATGSAQAAWQLDNAESQLNFLSIKKGDIAEINVFKELRGSVGDNGEVRLEIPLASVDSKIPVRDERLRDILFEVEHYPQAVIQGRLPVENITALPVGGRVVETFGGELNLHGVSKALQGEVLIVRIAENKLLAISYQPILLDAQNFNFGAALEKLREIAGLPSISASVPVNFSLTFQAQ